MSAKAVEQHSEDCSDESTTGNQYGAISESPDQIEAPPTAHQDAFIPPFLVRTKTHEEKQNMRDRLKEQEEQRKNKHHKGPYHLINKYYNKFSPALMLENKAATARDHLGSLFFIFYPFSFFSDMFYSK